jgi:hypothetical protein
MSRRIFWIGFSLLMATAGQAFAGSVDTPAGTQAGTGAGTLVQVAGCEAGDKIDGTTEAQTKKRIEAAGYTQVRDLTKACDNVWHGNAVNKDGTPGNVMVTPQGEVMPEGN